MKKNVYNEFIAALKVNRLSDPYAGEIADLMSKDLYERDMSPNTGYYDEIMEARLLRLKKAIQTTLINIKTINHANQ